MEIENETDRDTARLLSLTAATDQPSDRQANQQVHSLIL